MSCNSAYLDLVHQDLVSSGWQLPDTNNPTASPNACLFLLQPVAMKKSGEALQRAAQILLAEQQPLFKTDSAMMEEQAAAAMCRPATPDGLDLEVRRFPKTCPAAVLSRIGFVQGAFKCFSISTHMPFATPNGRLSV